MGPRIFIFLGNDTADERTRQNALILLSAVPCSSHSLTSCIRSYLFLDWRRTVSSKFFNTQILSVSTKKLVLPCQARCVLSRLRCTGHSPLLNSYISKMDRI